MSDQQICGARREMVTLTIGGVEVSQTQICQQAPGHYDPPNNPHGFWEAWLDPEDEPDESSDE